MLGRKLKDRVVLLHGDVTQYNRSVALRVGGVVVSGGVVSGVSSLVGRVASLLLTIKKMAI